MQFFKKTEKAAEEMGQELRALSTLKECAGAGFPAFIPFVTSVPGSAVPSSGFAGIGHTHASMSQLYIS